MELLAEEGKKELEMKVIGATRDKKSYLGSIKIISIYIVFDDDENQQEKT